MDSRGIASSRRLLILMGILQKAAFDVIQDESISEVERRQVMEEILVANSLAYASWAEAQEPNSELKRLLDLNAGVQEWMVRKVN